MLLDKILSVEFKNVLLLSKQIYVSSFNFRYYIITFDKETQFLFFNTLINEALKQLYLNPPILVFSASNILAYNIVDAII